MVPSARTLSYFMVYLSGCLVSCCQGQMGLGSYPMSTGVGYLPVTTGTLMGGGGGGALMSGGGGTLMGPMGGAAAHAQSGYYTGQTMLSPMGGGVQSGSGYSYSSTRLRDAEEEAMLDRAEKTAMQPLNSLMSSLSSSTGELPTTTYPVSQQQTTNYRSAAGSDSGGRAGAVSEVSGRTSESTSQTQESGGGQVEAGGAQRGLTGTTGGCGGCPCLTGGGGSYGPWTAGAGYLPSYYPAFYPPAFYDYYSRFYGYPSPQHSASGSANSASQRSSSVSVRPSSYSWGISSSSSSPSQLMRSTTTADSQLTTAASPRDIHWLPWAYGSVVPTSPSFRVDNQGRTFWTPAASPGANSWYRPTSQYYQPNYGGYDYRRYYGTRYY